MERLARADADAVDTLKAMILRVPRRPDVWVRASEHSDHIGAVLADASLQPGLNYVTVVAPRVKRVAQDYPVAATVSGLAAVLSRTSPQEVLSVKNARKCSVFCQLVDLLQLEGVETSDQLRAWLEQPTSKPKLLAINGIGHKTAAYLRLLLGLPAIAIDVHLRRVAASVGVVGSDEDLERLYTLAAEAAGLSLRELDGSLWQAGADGWSGAT